MDYAKVKDFLERHGFQFERNFRKERDAYTYRYQFLGYHESPARDYTICLERWLYDALGYKWHELVQDTQVLLHFNRYEREDIDKAVEWIEELRTRISERE